MAQSCDRIVGGLRKTGFIIDIIHFTNRGKGFKRKQQQNGSYMPIPYEDSESHVLNVTWNLIGQHTEYDCIICFGGYLSMIGAPIFSQWTDKPLITFLRGNDFDTAIFTPRKRAILQDALLQSNTVFCVSGDKVNKIKRWVPETHVVHVPNSIDITNWQPVPSEIEFASKWKDEHAGDKLCLGLFGQLKAKKGAKFFVQAMSKTGLVDKAHLLLIGDTEEALEQMLEEAGISYSLLPFQDRYELMKYYLCCDALAIPSFYDGMPNVMLEAGALGIPILASSVDGMKDVVEHEVEGLLFAPGSEEDCRKVLYQFFGMDEKDHKALGVNLKEKIINKFNIDHEISKYQELISQTIYSTH
ncbi:MAG: glycosyltransferase family 4 protein [Bacteroidota bacterium]